MTLFGTAGIRGRVTESVTPELALAVGRAVGLDARDLGEAEVIIGRDARTTGAGLTAAVEAGLESAGVDAIRAGLLPTPALAFASRGRRGMMLTASHNPPHDNGIKVFADGSEYDSEAEARIEGLVNEQPGPVAWDQWGTRRRIDVLDRYRDAVVAYAMDHGAALDGLRVAVDCGNGTASLATPQVLRSLDAHVIALNANVDGQFPGRQSKPTEESLSDLRGFVADAEVAFGIGHDGDGDRIVVVDGEGDVVHEDTVLAILAESYVGASDTEEPVVVTTPNASSRVDERVVAAGGRTERVDLGRLHEGIAAVRADGGDVVFAGEPWKHVHPDFGGWIDGVVSAAVFARLTAKSGLDALREPVAERPYRKRNVRCPDAKKPSAMQSVEQAVPEAFPAGDVDTRYGIRVDLADGSWVLVRPSGTEPYLRIYAEGDDVDGLIETAKRVVEEAVAAAS